MPSDALSEGVWAARPPLYTAVHLGAPLYHCTPLYTTVHHCTHCTALYTTVHHCTPLYTLSRRSTPLPAAQLDGGTACTRSPTVVPHYQLRSWTVGQRVHAVPP